MTQRHKHYDVIVAWAEGKPIQYKQPNSEKWIDQVAPTFALGWHNDHEYRIKPEVIKYRLGLRYFNTASKEKMVFTINSPTDEPNNEAGPCFIRWLGPWKEVEV